MRCSYTPDPNDENSVLITAPTTKKTTNATIMKTGR